MRDCSSCKHSAHKRPELAEMPFEKTPCSKCEFKEPTRVNIVSYGPHFEHPSDTTWKILDAVENDDTRPESEQYMEYLRADQQIRSYTRFCLAKGAGTPTQRRMIFMFSRAEEEVLALLAKNNWDMSLSEIGRKTDTKKSKQAVHKLIKRISMLSPELKTVIGGGK